jgi:hypothetical protein
MSIFYSDLAEIERILYRILYPNSAYNFQTKNRSAYFKVKRGAHIDYVPHDKG